MTKKAKDPSNGTHDQEEKLFDFDKSFDNTANQPTDADQDEKTSELESAVAELKDKNLRLLADFDNYKKRTVRERLDLMNSASRDVISALLPILDDFDRAKKSAEKGLAGENWSEGVEMIYNRLYNVLQSYGLKAMESTGQAFDPDLHEAITEIPSPTPDLIGTVIDTIEKGYMLNDKIIRHAKVVVGN